MAAFDDTMTRWLSVQDWLCLRIRIVGTASDTPILSAGPWHVSHSRRADIFEYVLSSTQLS